MVALSIGCGCFMIAGGLFSIAEAIRSLKK